MVVEHAHGQPEHVLEVDPPGAGLAPFVAVEDAAHQLGGDRRVVRLGPQRAEIRAGRDLVRDAMRDRGGLPGAGPREDRDRAADGLGGRTLSLVQAVEDASRIHSPGAYPGARARLSADRPSDLTRRSAPTWSTGT